MTGLKREQLDAIRPLGTSLVADAIDSFGARLPNQGFVRGFDIHDKTPELAPLLGYAVPARVYTSEPPMKGSEYAESASWWDYIVTLPEPRVIVFQDCDSTPGVGALLGPLHARVKKSLGCVGIVTNGALRDVSELRKLQFHSFAAGTSVTRAYAHVAQFGVTVRLGGLDIAPGDLLYGDENGVLSIPKDLAKDVPTIAQQIARERARTRDACDDPGFSIEKLRALTQRLGYSVADTGMFMTRSSRAKKTKS